MAERRRRKRLNDRLSVLRSIVPKISKAKLYGQADCKACKKKEIDLKNHKWGHYFVCGFKGFYEFAKSKGIDVGKAVGLEVVVDGIATVVTHQTWES